MFDLRVWPGVEGSEKTPGKAPDRGKEQMQRLAKLAKKHRNGHMPKVDWLDRLTFREIEMINEKEKRSSDYMYLMIEFPTVQIDGINHAVVYYEQDGDEMYQFRAQAEIVTVPDYEILQENLVESKQHRLARSLRSGVSGRDAKPTAAERDQLAALVAAPPAAAPPAADQDLVWKFRFYLSSHKRALTKFLECVNWNRPGEVRQALSMMKQWAPMDVEDALELLTPKFTHPAVRKYAISRLKQAPDEDLLLYLLQLVQALKYEDYLEIQEECVRICGKEAIAYSEVDGKLVQSGQRGSQASLLSVSGVLTSSETSTSTSSPRSAGAAGAAGGAGAEAAAAAEEDGDSALASHHYGACEGSEGCEGAEGEEGSLARFLAARASSNSVVANYLYWYLLVECEDQDGAQSAARPMYLTVMRIFSQRLARGNADHQRTRLFLARQQVFIDKLVKLVKTVARESGNRNKKAERLQQLLADPDAFKFNFTNFEPMPFPLDPNVTIKGIVAKKASLFKSALMPSKLTFLTTEGMEYEAIFKHGDDLRQDQLILQMITLMDKLLRRENLDLKLTPYKVLATSSKHGFLQFIESVTVADALTTEGSIQNFFRKHNPCESAPYGIKPETMDTYIRSCAGYCVITYLLGVGDRHLDNLLLTKSGALFHIDFGYILGRDPKPLPPPMKLSKEMVEAMGGIHSEHYHEFRKQCYTAFLHLRRHANLMLNLFSLMVDASVPDIALEPDKAVKKVQDKLRLDLGDEEAVHYLQNLLDMSVTAVMAVLVEHFHKFAQYWRK
ncbi:phosphatidylinositol 3-kinase catalytic subunit type 3 isoform X2 [Achroia grisella]|nr:phosphatidylinositol 3-kinase catalytic subunit type 3 isoform X2 [Achroia grisella]